MLDIWRMTWFFGLTGLTLVSIPSKLPLNVRLLWSYCLFSALLVFQSFRPNDIVSLAYLTPRMIGESAGQAFSQLLIIPLSVFFLRKHVSKKQFLMGFSLLSFIDAILVCVIGYGIMIAHSFDTALIAAIFPLALIPWKYFSIVPVFLTQGSTAIGILVSQFIAKAFVTKRWKTALILSGICVLAASFIQAGNLLDNNGRVAAWERFFSWWADQSVTTWIFGTGAGTFQWIGPAIDGFGTKGPMHGQVFMQMHCDWAQILFEYGAVGLLLSLWVYLDCLRRTKHSPTLFSTVVGCGVFMATYHPLHFFPSALFFMWLGFEIFKPNGEIV